MAAEVPLTTDYDPLPWSKEVQNASVQQELPDKTTRFLADMHAMCQMLDKVTPADGDFSRLIVDQAPDTLLTKFRPDIHPGVAKTWTTLNTSKSYCIEYGDLIDAVLKTHALRNDSLAATSFYDFSDEYIQKGIESGLFSPDTPFIIKKHNSRVSKALQSMYAILNSQH